MSNEPMDMDQALKYLILLLVIVLGGITGIMAIIKLGTMWF